jgi:hypothetical protein
LWLCRLTRDRRCIRLLSKNAVLIPQEQPSSRTRSLGVSPSTACASAPITCGARERSLSPGWCLGRCFHLHHPASRTRPRWRRTSLPWDGMALVYGTRHRWLGQHYTLSLLISTTWHLHTSAELDANLDWPPSRGPVVRPAWWHRRESAATENPLDTNLDGPPLPDGSLCPSRFCGSFPATVASEVDMSRDSFLSAAACLRPVLGSLIFWCFLREGPRFELPGCTCRSCLSVQPLGTLAFLEKS